MIPIELMAKLESIIDTRNSLEGDLDYIEEIFENDDLVIKSSYAFALSSLPKEVQGDIKDIIVNYYLDKIRTVDKDIEEIKNIMNKDIYTLLK